MIDWFRSWHGAPTDPKWLMIAQRTQTNAGMVSAVVWALFDHASQQNERGNVESFDPETYAAFSGWEADKIAAIVESLKAKGVIQNNRLVAWDKRQPKREDGSAERAKEWRERNRTQPNAKEHREEKIREEKKEEDTAGAVTSIYVFEAGIIRLTRKDFDQWKGAFENLNLEAELLALREWADKQGPRRWFGAVSGALAKRNREALAAKNASAEQQKSDGLTDFERNNIKYYGTKNRNLWGVV